MKMSRFASFGIVALCALRVRPQAAASDAFQLRNGDRVVFYGDSITAQRFYTVYVETAVHARHPDWNISFFNAGVGGDNVQGGIAGTIDQRLARDVFRNRPTVVTIMLGMNDRSHVALYEAGYEHILQAIRTYDPSIRITILGPTPVDGITTNNTSANVDLDEFGKIDRALAVKFSGTFIDLHTPVLTALRRAQRISPIAAASLIPDQIHPQPPIHMLMAETILRGWKFPESAANVILDVRSGTAIRSSGSDTSEIRSTAEGLDWTEIDASDELRFMSSDGNEKLYHALIGTQHVGTRLLTVKGLVEGKQYDLYIDGKKVGAPLRSEDLQVGIHLELLDTPMHRAGVKLFYACSAAELNQTDRARMLGTLATLQPPGLLAGGEKFLDDSISRSLEKVRTASSRQKHSYQLVSTKTARAPVPRQAETK